MAAEEIIFDDSPMGRYLQGTQDKWRTRFEIVTQFTELEQENKVQHATVVSSSLNEEILKALNEISLPAEEDPPVEIQKQSPKSTNSKTVMQFN